MDGGGRLQFFRTYTPATSDKVVSVTSKVMADLRKLRRQLIIFALCAADDLPQLRHAPADFMTLVEDVRRFFASKGCVMQSDFRLHVTLGRVQDPRMNVRKLKDIISQVQLPTFTMTLQDVEYRIFRGKTLGLWKLMD